MTDTVDTNLLNTLVDCYDCKGTSKTPLYKHRIREHQANAALDALLVNIDATVNMRAMSDAQVADLVSDDVYENFGPLSVYEAIISQVIDRLRRNGGGELPPPEDET